MNLRNIPDQSPLKVLKAVLQSLVSNQKWEKPHPLARFRR
jgi:hypothetical protein